MVCISLGFVVSTFRSFVSLFRTACVWWVFPIWARFLLFGFKLEFDALVFELLKFANFGCLDVGLPTIVEFDELLFSGLH